MNRQRANRVCARIGCGILALSAAGAVRCEPLDTLRACAEHAPPAQIGLEALVPQCPQLGPALSQLGIEPWLAQGWQSRLDHEQLVDLASLAGRYHGTVPFRPIDASLLPEILKTLHQAEPPAPNSLWEAFKAWVSDWLSRLDRRLGSWFDRLLGGVGATISVITLLLYGLIGLVLIAAAAVVVNELRASGALHRFRSPASARSHGSDTQAVALQSPGIEALPLYERPAQLLRMLVRRLVETGRLDRERTLTHDELVSRGVFDNAGQRAAFRAVAGVAVRILYGAQRPPASEIEPALSEGCALLTQIAALPDAPR